MPISFDTTQIAGFAETLEKAPELFAEEITKAYDKTGRYTNEQIRADAMKGLQSKGKGPAKAFKYKASDKNKVGGDINKVFVDFYSKWKAAGIFDTGGTIHPAIAGGLTILTDKAKGASGRRRWTSQQIVMMIDSGQLRLIKTPSGWLIVQPKGGLTNTGKMRKGTRDDIIAIIKKSVKEPKRIHFTETVEHNIGFLIDAIETAIENVALKLGENSGNTSN